MHFYHACLDRIDLLTTEKNSSVTLPQQLNILRSLAQFRPKEIEQQSRIAEMKFGEYKAKDSDDYMSVRHKEIIQEKSDKFITVPAHMGRFVYKNLT